MALALTNTGITIDTLPDILARLNQGMRDIYGDDIDLRSNTPDGQRVGIFSTEIADIHAAIQALYSNLDIDLSSGTFQDVIAKIAGVTRRAATRSTVDVTVVTDRPLTLPAGFIRNDTLGQGWITLVPQTLVQGDNTVTMVSQAFGAIAALPNTITQPVTEVIGVASTTNPAAAVIGIEEETDEQLRIRRNRGLESAALSTLGGIIAKLVEVPGVTDVVGYENRTPVQDTVRDIEPHTIWIVLEGGTVADITETIVRNLTGGTGMKGSVTGTFTETVPVGSSVRRINHSVKFDRPVDTRLYINLSAKRTIVGSAIDVDLIARNLTNTTFGIAEELTAASLYPVAVQDVPNAALYDLEISDDGTMFTDQSLFPGYARRFILDVTDVTVTEVV